MGQASGREYWEGMSVRRGQEIYAHACIPLDNASQEDAGYPSLRNYEYCQYYSLHGDKATHLDHPPLLVAFRFRHDFGWKRWRFMTKLISSPGFGRLLFFNLGRDVVSLLGAVNIILARTLVVYIIPNCMHTVLPASVEVFVFLLVEYASQA